MFAFWFLGDELRCSCANYELLRWCSVVLFERMMLSIGWDRHVRLLIGTLFVY
jgi:hypothetical protein